MKMMTVILINMLLPGKTLNDADEGAIPGLNWLTGVFLTFLLIGVGYAVGRLNKYKVLNRELTFELENEKICLAQIAEEKEFLVREIHHRVKNNLQIMMSLLNMQSSYLNSDEAITAIRNSNHRLFAISLVHQKLYQTDSLSSIDVPVYLHELGQYLQYELGALDRVTVQINAAPLCLDVSSAIPLGLIVHEVLSNAFKHGFRDGRKGSVTVDLHSEDDLQFLLQISDNGAGFPDGFDITETGSLGHSLMNGLSRQLRGKLAIQNQNGVTVSLVFSKDITLKDA